MHKLEKEVFVSQLEDFVETRQKYEELAIEMGYQLFEQIVPEDCKVCIDACFNDLVKDDQAILLKGLHEFQKEHFLPETPKEHGPEVRVVDLFVMAVKDFAYYKWIDE